jgi:GNAT superfamily N-acetyltransferase
MIRVEMLQIELAQDVQAIAGCFPTMAQLRPQLTQAAFIERVQRQQQEYGYRLAFALMGGDVAGVAGYRILECLAWGKFLYVDDLVTDAACRSSGVGKSLLDWLVLEAKRNDCDQLHLDSGVQRFDAHRFYLRERMSITSHHFAIDLRSL